VDVLAEKGRTEILNRTYGQKESGLKLVRKGHNGVSFILFQMICVRMQNIKSSRYKNISALLTKNLHIQEKEVWG